MEPLVATINNNQKIEGLGKGRKRNIKCPSYADDLTLTSLGSHSVALVFETIQHFSEATGLKLNIQKTPGMAVSSSSIFVDLPSINWNNETIKVLGLKIGKINPNTICKDSLDNLRTQKLAITVPFQTWQAKSLLAKTKLLPQLAYVARTYPLDIATQRVVKAEFLNFLTNNPSINPSIKNLQRPIIKVALNIQTHQFTANFFYQQPF